MKPMTLLFWAVAALLMIALWMLLSVTPAHAEAFGAMPVHCGPTQDWEAEIKNKYHESMTGIGVTPKGNLIRLFQSVNTWTIILSQTDGTSCTIAAGEDWQTEKAGDKT